MTKKPILSYCKALYVQVPDRKLFDSIANNLPSYAEGGTNICIPWSDFVSELDDAEENNLHKKRQGQRSMYKFLLEVRKKAKGKIGDVVFWHD